LSKHFQILLSDVFFKLFPPSNIHTTTDLSVFLIGKKLYKSKISSLAK